MRPGSQLSGLKLAGDSEFEQPHSPHLNSRRITASHTHNHIGSVRVIDGTLQMRGCCCYSQRSVYATTNGNCLLPAPLLWDPGTGIERSNLALTITHQLHTQQPHTHNSSTTTSCLGWFLAQLCLHSRSRSTPSSFYALEDHNSSSSLCLACAVHSLHSSLLTSPVHASATEQSCPWNAAAQRGGALLLGLLCSEQLAVSVLVVCLRHRRRRRLSSRA